MAAFTADQTLYGLFRATNGGRNDSALNRFTDAQNLRYDRGYSDVAILLGPYVCHFHGMLPACGIEATGQKVTEVTPDEITREIERRWTAYPCAHTLRRRRNRSEGDRCDHRLGIWALIYSIA